MSPEFQFQRFEYANSRMPISMTQGSTKYYLHYDQVGSLRAISDSNHNIIKEVVYDSFGNILSDSNESIKVPFGFAGGLSDKDTGLTRFGFRDYDSYTGKWTAKDPIDFSGGDTNLYGYVLNDPVNFVDVDGLHGEKNPIEAIKSIWNQRDDIWNDITSAYDNAHPALQMCIDGSLTIIEYSVTYGWPIWASGTYDYYSGYNFNTFPTSVSGGIGYTYGNINE